MKKLLLILVLAVMCSSFARADDSEDTEKAYQRKSYVQHLAEQGDAVAQYYLGMMYGNGEGVTLDHKEALKWFHLSAEQGVADAQYYLGSIYTLGIGEGVTHDHKEAAKFYRLAAEQGHVDAQFELGVLYSASHELQDYKEATKYFRLAAEQGDAQAQWNLGRRYDKGEGVTQDYVRAHMWYNLSADNGSEPGSEFLGIITIKMTPAQISKAQNMAKDCLKKKYKNCD